MQSRGRRLLDLQIDSKNLDSKSEGRTATPRRLREIQPIPLSKRAYRGSNVISSHDVGKSNTRRILSVVNQTVAKQERMAFGNMAEPGQFPYVAYIRGNTLCTGTLIHPRVVMTAAHCVTAEGGNWSDINSLKIKVGVVKNTQGHTYRAKLAITPNYDPDSEHGDIALLLLDRSATNAKTIALANPKTNMDGVKQVLSVGWGETQAGFFPDILRYSALPTISREKCLVVHRQMGVMPNDHFCVGLDPDGRANCAGDSGGPVIMQALNSTTLIQVGLVSYGPANYTCGQSTNNLDVLTSIIYWRKWIEDTLSIYNMRGKVKPLMQNVPDLETCYQGGNLLLSLPLTSAADCVDTCRNLALCRAWTWNSASKTCEFRETVDEKASSIDCVSGQLQQWNQNQKGVAPVPAAPGSPPSNPAPVTNPGADPTATPAFDPADFANVAVIPGVDPGTQAVDPTASSDSTP